MKTLAPVRRQMVVPVAADLAFSIFTDEISAWWPVGVGHNVLVPQARPVFRDGKIVELGADGSSAEWGTVLEWSPPRLFRMTWHPGRGPENPTEVTVSFESIADAQTLVTLEHTGWEKLANPLATRGEYAVGWPFVLGTFVELAGAKAVESGPGAPVWLTLMHAPGPAIATGASVFDHPGMRAHVGFVAELLERGVLLAAGPIGADGDGMTIVKLADADEAADIVRMAQDDDESVASGVLQVRARPWHVRFTA